MITQSPKFICLLFYSSRLPYNSLLLKGSCQNRSTHLFHDNRPSPSSTPSRSGHCLGWGSALHDHLHGPGRGCRGPGHLVLDLHLRLLGSMQVSQLCYIPDLPQIDAKLFYQGTKSEPSKFICLHEASADMSSLVQNVAHISWFGRSTDEL